MRVKALRDHRVTSVAAGSVHMCVLTDLGHLYSCGKSEYTGHGTRHDVLEPILLDVFEGVPVRSDIYYLPIYHTYTQTYQDTYIYSSDMYTCCNAPVIYTHPLAKYTLAVHMFYY